MARNLLCLLANFLIYNMVSKYITKQKHLNSCGPVAIMNAIKWLGGNINYTQLDMFTSFGFDYKTGMVGEDISNTLKTLGIRHLIGFSPSVTQLKEQLKKGHGLILIFNHYTPVVRYYGKTRYTTKFPLYHAVFIPNIIDNKYFQMLNNNGREKVSFKALANDLKFTCKASHNIAAAISIPKQ